tara:strand:+ start:1146 stop:1505 length:360 start_codon:yes stop_codon:yes gene_type:complete
MKNIKDTITKILLEQEQTTSKSAYDFMQIHSVEIFEDEIEEGVRPEVFVKGGNTKVTAGDIDDILSKIFTKKALAKKVEDSKPYKAGYKSKGRGKNPYEEDTADYHLYILGVQAEELDR